MADNKLFEIIKALSIVEKKECTAFLKSSYHNRREDVIRLWELLTGAKQKSVDAKTAFLSIYNGQTYDDAQWRYLQSFLLGSIEAFLAQRAWEKSPILSDLHLISVYKDKKLNKPLEHTFRRANERLQKIPQDSNYYHLW